MKARAQAKASRQRRGSIKPHPIKLHPRRAKKRCTQTGKIKWCSQLDAKLAMANTSNKQGSNTRRDGNAKREIRSYKCPHCDFWHTTSQPYKPWLNKDKDKTDGQG